MTYLLKALYTVSGALLVPVIVLLLLGFAWSLVDLGVCIAEALERRRDRRRLSGFLQKLGGPPGTKQDVAVRSFVVRSFFDERFYGGLLGRFIRDGKDVRGSPRELAKVIDGIEGEIDRRVTRSMLAVRIGPMLGLMGTLIPMGPALTDLAQGNIEGMAEKLVIAFSTTVIGLAVGGLGYLVTATRRRWYAMDLREIEYLHDVATERSADGSDPSNER